MIILASKGGGGYGGLDGLGDVIAALPGEVLFFGPSAVMVLAGIGMFHPFTRSDPNEWTHRG